MFGKVRLGENDSEPLATMATLDIDLNVSVQRFMRKIVKNVNELEIETLNSLHDSIWFFFLTLEVFIIILK